MPAEETADRQYVTALARGLEILSCFAPGRTELGGSEIAALTGLPQPTVWRLCYTMVKLGYLVQTGADKMRPGIPTLRLGFTALSSLDITEVARPDMKALADRFSAACSLAVYDEGSMLFVQRCESESQLLMNLRVGSRISVASSALGWAFLAALPVEERRDVMAKLAKRTSDWAALFPRIKAAIAECEKVGYITNTGQFHQDYNTAAVAIRGRDGRPRYALSCGGVSSNVTVAAIRETIGPRLVALAEALEAV